MVRRNSSILCILMVLNLWMGFPAAAMGGGPQTGEGTENITQLARCMDLVDLCQQNLNLCQFNNTELLTTIAGYTAPVPGVNAYQAFVYTLFGAFISLFGVAATYCCDTLTSWYFSKKSEKHLVRKMDDMSRTLIDEIRNNSLTVIKARLARCRAVLISTVMNSSRRITEEQAEDTIDGWLAKEGDADDIATLNQLVDQAAASAPTSHDDE
ncbi:MAG TPA: hypothetical protein VEL47_03690 [Myxococcota bacterium]|nr:hypothetical protein [Myxococcota bacterium]